MRRAVSLVIGLPCCLPAVAEGPNLDERLDAQRAIERIYYEHRVGTTRPFEEAVPHELLVAKVEDLLRRSVALERLWHTPVTTEMLETELKRIARETRFPERLAEIYDALGHDARLIRETFARASLVTRLTGNFLAGDPRFEGRPWDDFAVADFAVVADRDARLPATSGEDAACPTEDSWKSLTDVTPTRRARHTVVWTGSELIVWGGVNLDTQLADGGAYDPLTDTWRSVSTLDEPPVKEWHTAVWTGSEMIVWGGWANDSRIGGAYDPASDTWRRITTDGAPSFRYLHAAVWTGSEMIVWGGASHSGGLDDGARYDPDADVWTPVTLTGAPAARANATAVWTGSEMIVWGGCPDEFQCGNPLDSGGRYDPATDQWSPTSTTGAPAARFDHSAVWTGSEMIVWGGGSTNTGGRYDPVTDLWTPTSLIDAPSSREDHAAIWSGTEMIVWGGNVGELTRNDGGRYDPVSDSWTPIASSPTRSRTSAVWTGSEMLVRGTCTDQCNDDSRTFRFDPLLADWFRASDLNAPPPATNETAVWTGTEMIVWGGVWDSLERDTGGGYDPLTDSWAPTTTNQAPSARQLHTAAWTGTEMIVWGGYDGTNRVATGRRYLPASDVWLQLGAAGPAARSGHTAIWSGTEMIVWGGRDGLGPLGDGGRYDPGGNSWSSMTNVDAPSARNDHTAIWSGAEMIVWGGGGASATGGRYDPAIDQWTAVTTTGAPVGRDDHTAVWSGTEMIVWGGSDLAGDGVNSGGRYDPSGDSWTATSLVDAPSPRSGHEAVWTGSSMLVWGGGVRLVEGGIYYPDPAVDADFDTVCVFQDCDDQDDTVWQAPGEVAGLRFDDETTLSWDPPAEPGAIDVLYDVLRSEDPADFTTTAICLESDDTDLTAQDAAAPGAGLWAYLVRAENDCPIGEGSLGSRTSGAPRLGVACP